MVGKDGEESSIGHNHGKAKNLFRLGIKTSWTQGTVAAHQARRSLCYVSRHQSKRRLNFARRSTPIKHFHLAKLKLMPRLIDDSPPPFTSPHPPYALVHSSSNVVSSPQPLRLRDHTSHEAFFPLVRGLNITVVSVFASKRNAKAHSRRKDLARQCLPLSARCRVEGSRRSARRLLRWVEGPSREVGGCGGGSIARSMGGDGNPSEASQRWGSRGV